MTVAICLVLFCNCVKRFNKNREKSEGQEQNGRILYYPGALSAGEHLGQRQFFDLHECNPSPLPQRYPGEYVPPVPLSSVAGQQCELPLLWDYGQIDGPGAKQTLPLHSRASDEAPIT
ncbi:uncharacterized protein LOC141913387 [Tubulanus polymorphus]|uniref:uncharacterized protein LOC141913387 n=1 Tax=Tubulanus polymorphus TaxID=672921 RepID=UPI003DA6A682